MADKPHPALFKLQHLVSDLSKVDRRHYKLNTDTRESDVEHSFSVAMLCWFILTNNRIDLDLSLVLQYALAHDFVERYAGDTNTFASPKQRQAKIQKEKVALQRFGEEFGDFPSLVDVMQRYETKEDSESLFVWTVDKMQPLILSDMDGNWRPYNELGINYETFSEKYADLLTQASPYCKEIFDSLIQYCQSTYYSRPNPSQQR